MESENFVHLSRSQSSASSTQSAITQSTTMASPKQTVKVAAIQAEPAWNDLQGGVAKSIALIEEAAANGTNVLGFPEVFIPGYPW